MNLFRSIVFSALVTGLLSGILAAGLHFATTVPLIAQAEIFEHRSSAHATEGDEDHAHDTSQSDSQRALLTLVAMVLTFIGFALVIAAAGAASGSLQGWRSGLLWGLAGFIAFTVAPGIGLPPELPAMPAAELEARQVWWVAAVFCSAVGMAIIYRFRDSAAIVVLGAIIALVPHVLGAPQVAEMTSPIPADLHSNFVGLTIAVSFVSWSVMGMMLGWIWKRWNPTVAQARILQASKR